MIFGCCLASLTSLMAVPPASRTVLLDLTCAHHFPPVTPFNHVHGFDSREFSLPACGNLNPRWCASRRYRNCGWPSVRTTWRLDYGGPWTRNRRSGRTSTAPEILPLPLDFDIGFVYGVRNG